MTPAVEGQTYSLEQIEGLKFVTTQDGLETRPVVLCHRQRRCALTETVAIKVIGINEA